MAGTMSHMPGLATSKELAATKIEVAVWAKDLVKLRSQLRWRARLK